MPSLWSYCGNWGTKRTQPCIWPPSPVLWRQEDIRRQLRAFWGPRRRFWERWTLSCQQATGPLLTGMWKRCESNLTRPPSMPRGRRGGRCPWSRPSPMHSNVGSWHPQRPRRPLFGNQRSPPSFQPSWKERKTRFRGPSLSPASGSWRNWTDTSTRRSQARAGWSLSPARRDRAKRPWSRNSPAAPRPPIPTCSSLAGAATPTPASATPTCPSARSSGC